MSELKRRLLLSYLRVNNCRNIAREAALPSLQIISLSSQYTDVKRVINYLLTIVCNVDQSYFEAITFKRKMIKTFKFRNAVIFGD